jgi:hypothetical protein
MIDGPVKCGTPLVGAIMLVAWLSLDAFAMLTPADIRRTEPAPSPGQSAVFQQIQDFQFELESKRIARRLANLGLSPADVQARLDSLTDEQVHQVARKLEGVVGREAFILLVALLGITAVALGFLALARHTISPTRS